MLRATSCAWRFTSGSVLKVINTELIYTMYIHLTALSTPTLLDFNSDKIDFGEYFFDLCPKLLGEIP